MLKDPILQAKEIPNRKDAQAALDLFMQIFNIEELVEEQKELKAAESNQPNIKTQPSFQS